MGVRDAFILVIALVLIAPASGNAQAPASDASDVIVLFRDGVTAAERERLVRQSGGVATRHFRNVPASAARAGARARAFLQRHPDVLSVVPDREVEKLGKPTGDASVTAAQVVPSGVMRVGAQPRAVAFTGAGVGVAPGATLYAVKVLDRRGWGIDSTIMEGLDWIVDNAALVTPAIRVVNMSPGRRGTLDDDPALRASAQAVVGAGITVVVAAGNGSTLEVSDQVPATYPEVIAVASTTATAGSSARGGHPSPVSSDTASYLTTDGAFDSLTGIGVSVSAPGEDREDISKS